MENIIQVIAVYAIPLIFAITIHEAAHGYVARYFGDNTAWVLGRVTLNPIKHIDPVGTILVPGVMLILSALSGFGGIIFGWAKPVPVNFSHLRNPKTDSIWVSAAGPVSNFLQALFWLFLIKIFLSLGVREIFFYEMCKAGITVNLVLMALNLIPIPPLDGGRIVTGLLPNRWAYKYAQIEPYGMWILIALIISGFLNTLMIPFLRLGSWLLNLFV